MAPAVGGDGGPEMSAMLTLTGDGGRSQSATSTRRHTQNIGLRYRDGIITTFAWNRTGGFSGDGPRTQCESGTPVGLRFERTAYITNAAAQGCHHSIFPPTLSRPTRAPFFGSMADGRLNTLPRHALYRRDLFILTPPAPLVR